MIRNLPSQIQVIFEPSEILAQRIGFKGEGYIADAFVFAARLKLQGTALQDVPIGATKVTLEKGQFVITMEKEQNAKKATQPRLV